jgi:flavin-dependent dehydrogenase
MWGRSYDKWELVRRLERPTKHPASDLQLRSGSRIAVVGGGPAGTFFAYFLLRLARRLELELNVDIYEPRFFDHLGPGGCNHCGGIISESLVQILASDGINLPPGVVQRGIDSYMLHTDVGSEKIEAPLLEMRIAAVFRGGGPRGVTEITWRSFDNYLLELAKEKGARVRRQMITDVELGDGRPCLKAADGPVGAYDLVVIATGVNSHLLERIESMGVGFKPPKTTTAFICEFQLGEEMVQRQLGSSMHVFLLDLPRLKFAALIPKRSCVTMCLLGDEIDEELVEAFLDSSEVRGLFAPGTGVPQNICHCFPRINIEGPKQPFADRMLFVGDSGVTRLYKDGIGAAYRTGHAAASAALLGGISTEDFRRHFLPACRKISGDNAIGKVVFWITGLVQHMRFARRAMLRMTACEQRSKTVPRRLSSILWDVFSGSAPYREVLLRALHPGFLLRLVWNTVLIVTPIGQRPIDAGEGRGQESR